MKQDSLTYKSLISAAKQNDYYASLTTLTREQRQRFKDKADEFRKKAEALPEDFVDAEFVMPEWGTYGT